MQVIGLVLLFFAAGSSSPPSHDVDFCKVVQSPEAFDGHNVTFTARVESDGMHGILLEDPRCTGAVTVDVSHAGDAFARLQDKLFEGQPGTLDKVVRARWGGLIERTKGHARLIVESIDQITSTARDGSN
jgi:hypothetical protein